MRKPTYGFLMFVALVAGAALGWFGRGAFDPAPANITAPAYAATPEVGHPGFPVPVAPLPHTPAEIERIAQRIYEEYRDTSPGHTSGTSWSDLPSSARESYRATASVVICDPQVTQIARR
jgi:hypothetical protein